MRETERERNLKFSIGRMTNIIFKFSRHQKLKRNEGRLRLYREEIKYS